jgi:hypothetical protein
VLRKRGVSVGDGLGGGGPDKTSPLTPLQRRGELLFTKRTDTTEVLRGWEIKNINRSFWPTFFQKGGSPKAYNFIKITGYVLRVRLFT